MFKLFISIFLILLFPMTAFAEEKEHLCTAEQCTGFRFTKGNKKWEQSFFKSDQKFIFAKKKDSGVYTLTRPGDSNLLCSGMKPENKDGVFNLKCNVGEFFLNPQNNRFIYTYIGGYISGIDEEGDDSFIMIGKCSP